MPLSNLKTGGLSRSVVLMCSFLAAAYVSACDTKPPTDADPKPPGQYLDVQLRDINDSTVAFDVVAADTSPTFSVIAGLELQGSPNPAPMGLGWPATAETTAVGPRYTVHFSGTFPSRRSLQNYNWVVHTRTLAGGRAYRAGRYYFGPKKLTLDVTGIPDAAAVGLDFVVATRGPIGIAHVDTYVDSGTAAQRVYGPVRPDSEALLIARKRPAVDANPSFHVRVPGPLANGAHPVTVVVTDDSGHVATFKKNITVDVPNRSYRIVPIIVAGAIDTYANGINNSGTVAATARYADSSTRAMRWIAGVAQLLPGDRASAHRINDSGHVAGYIERGKPADSIVVWRDSARTAVATGYGYRTPTAFANDGSVLVSSQRIDRNGRPTDFDIQYAADMNNLGVAVGTTTFYGRETARGGDPSGFGIARPYDAMSGMGSSWSPYVDWSNARFINDAGQIFASNRSGNFISAKVGEPKYLIAPLGFGSVEAISRGGLVLSRLTDSTIAVWRIGAETSRVVVDASQWKIDALSGINDKGQIIAHGVHRATGQKAGLLLDPM
jgi:hypothetical protein